MPDTSSGKKHEIDCFNILQQFTQSSNLKLSKNKKIEPWLKTLTKTGKKRKSYIEYCISNNNEQLIIECRVSGGGSFDAPKALDTTLKCLINNIQFLVVVKGINSLSTKDYIDIYNGAVNALNKVTYKNIKLTCCSIEQLYNTLEDYFETNNKMGRWKT